MKKVSITIGALLVVALTGFEAIGALVHGCFLHNNNPQHVPCPEDANYLDSEESNDPNQYIECETDPAWTPCQVHNTEELAAPQEGQPTIQGKDSAWKIVFDCDIDALCIVYEWVEGETEEEGYWENVSFYTEAGRWTESCTDIKPITPILQITQGIPPAGPCLGVRSNPVF